METELEVVGRELITGSISVTCPYCKNNHYHIFTQDDWRNLSTKGCVKLPVCGLGKYKITKVE